MMDTHETFEQQGERLGRDLSAERNVRIQSAIDECDRFITRQEARPRPYQHADLLAFYRRHRARLTAMLTEAGR
jgi:hypothetical protein